MSDRRECNVCLEVAMIQKRLNCGHRFCTACLEKQRDDSLILPCPLCRAVQETCESLPSEYCGLLLCNKCGEDKLTERMRWCENCHVHMCLGCENRDEHLDLNHTTHPFSSLLGIKAAAACLQKNEMEGNSKIKAFCTTLEELLCRKFASKSWPNLLMGFGLDIKDAARVGGLTVQEASSVSTQELETTAKASLTTKVSIASVGEPTCANKKHKGVSLSATKVPSKAVLLCGGYDRESDRYHRTCQLFYPNSLSFVPAPSLPSARFQHSAVLLKDSVFLIGGARSSDSEAGHSSVLRWSEGASGWQAVAALPHPRSNGAAVVYGDGIWVFGGWYKKPVGSSLVYDVEGDAWTHTPSPLPGGPRAALRAAVFDGLVYVVGGSGEYGSVRAVDVLDPREGVWKVGPPLTTPRSGHILTPLDGRLFAIGGESGHFAANSSVEVYDERMGKWELWPHRLTHNCLDAGACVL